MTSDTVQSNITESALTKSSFRYSLYICYFIVGLSHSMPLLPAKKLLMDTYKVSPSSMAAIFGLLSSPWLAKPLFALSIDAVAINQERRRPYIILAFLVNFFIFSALARIAENTSIMIIISFMFITSATIVLIDVAVNSIVIVNAKLETVASSGKLQSSCWIFKALGAMIGSGSSGYALAYLEHPLEILLTAIAAFSLSGALTSYFIKEIDSDSPEVDIINRVRLLITYLRRQDILSTILFVILMNCPPTVGDAFLYWMRYQLGFGMDVVGNLHFCRHFAHLVSAYFFRICLRQIPVRRLIALSLVVSSVLGLSTIIVVLRWNKGLGIPDSLFIFADTVALAIFRELILMPIIVLSSRIVPDGSEGPVYAMIMSFWNLGRVISEETGAGLIFVFGVTSDNYDRLWLVVLICNMILLAPILFLNMLPDVPVEASQKGESTELVPDTFKSTISMNTDSFVSHDADARPLIHRVNSSTTE
uniref:Major facilitator superfamily associated domain-containing protein n=1 Tax=Spongospora subterranea TaxID=70186 RepID=A0A0H5QHF5_9EUKA|eukprot:CRZ00771.1 hypothetical protein [Spongospora subterranea]